MRKIVLTTLAAATALSLAACGQKAKNEALEANESIGGDSNTMGEAVSDVNAAQDAAFNDAEASYANGSAMPANSDEIEE
jgi:hypothetical protein